MTRGRYAPSPTGALHLGNASTALLAWLQARAHGGRFFLRVEDHDRPRVVAGSAERILDDLRWMGLAIGAEACWKSMHRDVLEPTVDQPLEGALVGAA